MDNVMTKKRPGMNCLLYYMRGIYILNVLLSHTTVSTSIHQQKKKVLWVFREHRKSSIFYMIRKNEGAFFPTLLSCWVITIDGLQSNLSTEKPLTTTLRLRANKSFTDVMRFKYMAPSRNDIHDKFKSRLNSKSISRHSFSSAVSNHPTYNCKDKI